MRVLHINTTSHTGGAARAMRRLSKALREQGHESLLLVGRSKYPEDSDVRLIWDEVAGFRSLPESLLSRIGNRIERYLGIHPWANRPNRRISETDLYQWADIIDLRNLFGGFFNLWALPSLSASKPVVWRLPDLWAVTGHCAYPYQCQRWLTGCYSCPLLTREGRKKVEPPPTNWDGTRRVWRAKKDLYDRSQLDVIVTTAWMRDQVKQSILGGAKSIKVISNGVDLKIYHPQDRRQSRLELGLDPDEKILLWAAGGKGNYRKGYHLAMEALQRVQAERGSAPMLITMGGDEGWQEQERLERIRHFGYVAEPAQQAMIYAAADGFLCTTLADGQPQTALESLASGTPVIAFEIGPMPEEVRDGITGKLVAVPDPEALSLAISDFFAHSENLPQMGEDCRQQANQKYDLDKQTAKYIEHYQEILESRAG